MCQTRGGKKGFLLLFSSTALSVAHTVREVVFKVFATYKPMGLVDWRGSTPRQSDRPMSCCDYFVFKASNRIRN
jgi:hypothetical protein